MNALAGILFFVGFVPYVVAILRRKTVPSPISWGIWALIDVLVLLAMRKEGAATGQVGGATIGAFVITILALRFGTSKMGLVEWISSVGAALGIILWQTTGNPTTAIICSQSSAVLGAIPTCKKAYQKPEEEDRVAWLIWGLSCICALFAVKQWDLANALQPLVFATLEGVMIFLIVVRPWFMRKKSPTRCSYCGWNNGMHPVACPRDFPEDGNLRKEAWEDGWNDGKSGRNKRSHIINPAYHIGYDRGWYAYVHKLKSPREVDFPFKELAP